MDKRKLVNIIVKDIEEIRILSEEVAESEDTSALIIDLALYRARLLCQEIELLRDLVGNSPVVQLEEEDVIFDSPEEEDSFHDFPDPELEILNFEQDEYPQTEELADEEDFEEESDEDTEEKEEVEDDLEKEEADLEEDLEEDLTDEEDLDQEDDQEEIAEDDLDQEDDLEEIAEGDLDEDEDQGKITEQEQEDDMEEEPEEEEDIVKKEEDQKVTSIHATQLQEHPQPGVREIQIDDLDDEDEIEPVRFAPSTGTTSRPPMREIPKPDFLETESQENEKKVVGEKYQKERSLNDSIGEKKPMDSKLPFGRITSLRAAIGLNDRFLFIREIFDNNSEKYNKVIEQLDKMEQIQEAVEYLKANLTMQKNEASMKFVELLKRRFTP